MVKKFNIAVVDDGLQEALQYKIDSETKPLGVLAQLETSFRLSIDYRLWKHH